MKWHTFLVHVLIPKVMSVLLCHSGCE